MTEKRDQDSKKRKEKKLKKQQQDLNEELRQTFPASDPPSISRPGHERDKDKKE